jgi:hypothetical protein
MNEAHLHLLFNHFPITGLIISVLTLLFALILKKEQVEKAALFLILFCCLLSFPAFFSGEGAEEMVEELPGISHDLIHEHEEHAEPFIWFSGGLGALAFITLIAFFRSLKWKKYLSLGVAFLGLITVFMSFEVGNSGGLIRHPEIQENPENHSHTEEK